MPLVSLFATVAPDGATAIDPTAVVALIQAHAWVPLAALAIHVVLRLLEADVHPTWLTVPPAWRPWLALALGQVAGVLDAVAQGATWRAAVVGGFVAASLVIWQRAVPGAQNVTPGEGTALPHANGEAPPAPRAPTVPPVVSGLLVVLALAAVLGALTSCTASQRATARTVVDTVRPECSLVSVVSGSSVAGVVCSDVGALLSDLLASQRLAAAPCRSMVAVHDTTGASVGLVCAPLAPAMQARLTP
jgi:hypothetical protein